ncbi:ATP-binding protein [Prescottella equi]|uniref:ATP-binding protein n=1 Tax=Rhodococcus hoagii TaxID=43767 RepID=UPI001584AB56|nr:ATP-binding protein [Prescottella equi]
MGAVRQPPARNPLSRKEGWFRLAEAPARVRPPHLSWQELSALGDADRFAYDENRRNWHSNIGPLATPQLLTAHESMWEIVDSNRQDTGHAKGAIALDAYPGLGKTTIADSFGFAYHRALLARHGTRTEQGDDRIPVCYVGLTSNSGYAPLAFDERESPAVVSREGHRLQGIGLDPHGDVPLSSFGLGTRRLTSLSIQDEAMDGGSIIAIDEVEHGLEPHRLAQTLRHLKKRTDDWAAASAACSRLMTD